MLGFVEKKIYSFELEKDIYQSTVEDSIYSTVKEIAERYNRLVLNNDKIVLQI